MRYFTPRYFSCRIGICKAQRPEVPGEDDLSREEGANKLVFPTLDIHWIGNISNSDMCILDVDVCVYIHTYMCGHVNVYFFFIHSLLMDTYVVSISQLLWLILILNIGLQICLQDTDFTFFGYIPRSGTTRSYSSSTFNFLRNLLFSIVAVPIYIPRNAFIFSFSWYIFTNIWYLLSFW